MAGTPPRFLALEEEPGKPGSTNNRFEWANTIPSSFFLTNPNGNVNIFDGFNRFPTVEIQGRLGRADDREEVDIVKLGFELIQGDIIHLDLDYGHRRAVDSPNRDPDEKLDTQLHLFYQNGSTYERVANNDDFIEHEQVYGIPDPGSESSKDPALTHQIQVGRSGTYYIAIASVDARWGPRRQEFVDRDPEVDNNFNGDYLLYASIVPTPQFFINDVSVVEGTGGSQFANFTVSMDRASAFTHSVSYATANGIVKSGQSPAIEGQDYIGKSDQLNFAPGETTKDVSVEIVTDNVVELDENFFVNLFNPTGGAGIGDPQGIGTIINDDTAIVSISDVTLPEGNSGTSNADFSVTFSNPVDTNVVVDFQTADGTATVADNDYGGRADSVVFAQLTKEPTTPVTINVNGDTKVELDEQFFVNLIGLNASGRDVTLDPSRGADPQGLGTILNDDSTIVSINDVSVVEGDSGQKEAIFTVSLSQEVDAEVTLDWATAADTAEADIDFENRNGSVTFNPESTTETIVVPINGDTVVEQDETFFVNLSNLQANNRAVTLGKSQGIGTIINDDAATVDINDVQIIEGDDGKQKAVFTVNLSQEVDRAVTVDWATAADTAEADIDFDSANGNIAFAPGETSKKIEIDINGDILVEPDEQFFVNLSNLQNNDRAVTLGKSQGIGTILNDDIATISIDDVTQPEGNSGITPFGFLVSIDKTATEDITVIANTKGITATGAGSDFYDLVDLKTTIPAGSTSAQINLPIVPVIGDTLPEEDETFEVLLSDAKIGGISDLSRAIVGNDPGLGTIVNDDEFETDLSISKTDGVDNIRLIRDLDSGLPVDGTLTYTIEVVNNGLVPIGDIVVEDLFPTELSDITWVGVGSNGASGYETAPQTGNLIDDGIRLAPGASIVYTVNTKVDYFTSDGTIISNTASIRSNNPFVRDINPDNNSATDTTSVITCIRGTDGRDDMEGTEADDCIEALGGDDEVSGEQGNDTIFGGDGNDRLRGDRDKKKAGGQEGGDDTIYGGAGSDFIGGKGGNDRLFGDEGDDTIWGDDGDDLIRGGLGNDILTGDESNKRGKSQGSDTFILAIGEGTDTILDFEEDIDFIGLADGLSFGQLSFDGNDIKVGDEVLATLNGVETNALTQDRFVVV